LTHLPNYVHTIIAPSDWELEGNTKLDAEDCTYFDSLLVISALAQADKMANKPISNETISYNGKKKLFNKEASKYELLTQNRSEKFNASSATSKITDLQFKLWEMTFHLSPFPVPKIRDQTLSKKLKDFVFWEF
jgi:hypothetical protein